MIIDLLKILLTDEMVLYTKLRTYRRTLNNRNFCVLYTGFDKQQNEIADVIDEVAKQLRNYSADMPGTMQEFIGQAHLTEAANIYVDEQTMMASLVDDHNSVIAFLRQDLKASAEGSSNIGIGNLVTRLVYRHQKMVRLLGICTHSQPSNG